MKLNYEELYRFTDNFGSAGRKFRAGPQLLNIKENALTCGEYRPKKAISFEYRMGKNICDVIWTTLPPIVLVSNAFFEILKHGSLTGWSTYPVRVYDQEGNQIRGYVGLSFLGRAGIVDLSRSKTVWRGPAYDGGPKWQNYVGLYFKDDQWDGSDFFMAEGRSTTFVTQRAKDAMKELDIPNVQFDSLLTYEHRVKKPRSSLRLLRE